MILKENGYYWVGHDHKGIWPPKVHWIKDRLGSSGDSWIEERADYYDSYNFIRRPLRWGFRDYNMALMFVIAFPNVFKDDWRDGDEDE